MTQVSKKELEKLNEKILEIEKSLDIPTKREVLASLEKESSQSNFWENNKLAQDTLTQISDIRSEIEKVKKLKEDITTLLSLIDETSTEKQDMFVQDYNDIIERFSEFETLMFLSSKYDKNSATLSIHAGQGGTEANDWAEMLLRMYTMYVKKKGWKYEVTNIMKGNEVGIATVTMDIFGKYAYGMLKKEHGTHRLIRLSPFNAQNLRQTSFAGVEVIPILEDIDEEDIQIPPTDIDFKAVKSGGPGGQSVNKTSSAVQITHIPTGITVHSSTQRSQVQNKVKAMQILKGKLWKILEENRLKEIDDIKGEYKVAGWGNQIRNYILHPYKLVKDLRTGVESTNPESVLDGNIEEFLESEIRMK